MTMQIQRKKIVAGNWKMNLDFQEAQQLVSEIKKNGMNNNLEVIIFPASLYLGIFARESDRMNLSFGAQNCSEYETGAYTGEVSARMIKSVGATYCLVGHSERRTYFSENHQQLKSKIKRCLENGITPIYCIGETLEQRNNGLHFEIIRTQLFEVLDGVKEADFTNFVIAYEPVWAIGTGLTATPDEAQEMHFFIRKTINELKGKNIADKISILYGGSCNSKNAKQLFSCADIDGALIGGASLNIDDFLTICNSI